MNKPEYRVYVSDGYTSVLDNKKYERDTVAVSSKISSALAKNLSVFNVFKTWFFGGSFADLNPDNGFRKSISESFTVT